LWEIYPCEDKNPDTWPSLKFLTIDSFHNLLLTHSDKVLKKDGFQPENGIWPYRLIRGNNNTGHPGGIAAELTGQILPLTQSMESSSRIMGDCLISAMRKPSTKVAKVSNFRILFSRKIIKNDKEETYKTTSETYNDRSTTMGDIFEKMWQTDTSPVFFLTTSQEDGMKSKYHEFKMFISSEGCEREKPYTQQTFETDTIGSMVNLVGSPLVRVRIECVKKGCNKTRRQLFLSRSEIN